MNPSDEFLNNMDYDPYGDMEKLEHVDRFGDTLWWSEWYWGDWSQDLTDWRPSAMYAADYDTSWGDEDDDYDWEYESLNDEYDALMDDYQSVMDEYESQQQEIEDLRETAREERRRFGALLGLLLFWDD